MEPEKIDRLLRRACAEVHALALGWNQRQLLLRIYDIWRFTVFNSEQVIPLQRRRRISRLATDLLAASSRVGGQFAEALQKRAAAGQLLARDLQRELEGLGGLHGEFSDTLRALAGPEPAWRRNLKAGGDRRSGERTLKSSVLGMAVRLYCEAHANPRFSIDGPLVRFANALGELVLGETNPFSPDAVRAEFRRMKPNARRLSSLQSLYAKTVKQRRWKTRRPIKRRGVHESEVDLS
jgi:hypothetical protein